MKNSTSNIKTLAASSYIGKLCRHFAHKIETTYTETAGKAVFPAGACMMHASPAELRFEITAPDDEELDKIKGVLVRHLVKFAFREELVIEWRDGELSPD